MKLTGAQILLECLKAEGVETLFGYPGGVVLPLYDTFVPVPRNPARPRPARAVGRPRRRRLRPRQRSHRRLPGDLGPRRDQPRHRHLHGLHGLRTDGRADGQRRPRPARPRRLPGGRHHRHHAADHEAQLPRHARQRGGAGRQGGLPHRLHGPQGAGARRHPQGRVHRDRRLGRLPGAGASARLFGRHPPRSGRCRTRRPNSSTPPRSPSSWPGRASSSPVRPTSCGPSPRRPTPPSSPRCWASPRSPTPIPSRTASWACTGTTTATWRPTPPTS